jgi:Icc-related predicted phosphoesterase
MHIQLLSDLHLEFHRDDGAAFVDTLEQTADILVLAGDIVPFTHMAACMPALTRLAARYSHVLTVVGNHELYGSDTTYSFEYAAPARLAPFYSLPTVHLLNRRTLTINGVRFVGCTGWFPEKPSHVLTQHLMSDFSQIKHFTPWVYEQSQRDRAFLEKSVQAGDIVITHYLPHPACISPKFATSKLNDYFLVDYSDIIEDRAPALWLHGHTHDSVDVTAAQTRIVCNPFGYVGVELNPNFQEGLTLDLNDLH